MQKGVYINRVWVYASIFIVLLGQALGIATGNYVFPLLVYAAFVFIYLFYINKGALLFLILSARVFFDSIPQITYPKLAFGLSFMEYFTLGLMIFMFTYLLVYKGIELDAISKSMALILVAMGLTTIYHGNIRDLVDVGSLWLYFILAYLFFKYLLQDVSIEHILKLIVIISLYPFLNQLYSIIIGAGQTHLGFDRYAGTYRHPHNVADYLFFAIPAALYLFLTERRLKMKYIYIGAIALFHIGIFMAGYRTNWIAVFAFWTVYILFASRTKLVSFLLLFFIAIVSWQFVGEIISTKLMPVKTILENPDPLFSLEDYKYNRLLSGRIGIWKFSLDSYINSSVFEKTVGMGLRETDEITGRIIGPRLFMHNEYLSFLVETGIIGISLLFAWIFIVIKTLFGSMHIDKFYSLIVFSAFISCLVIGVGGMPFRDIRVINYMSFYLASVGFYYDSDKPITSEGY